MWQCVLTTYLIGLFGISRFASAMIARPRASLCPDSMIDDVVLEVDRDRRIAARNQIHAVAELL